METSRDQILQNTTFIENVNDCANVIQRILANYRLIAVDVKGHRFGVRRPLVFFLIATPDKFCYIFDIYICEHMILHGGIKHLLECYNIVKVMLDSKFFCDTMKCFNVDTNNIFDVQIAHQLIESARTNCSPSNIERLPLTCISRIYGRKLDVPEEYHYKQLERLHFNYLECRPVLIELVECIAREVLCLLPEVYVNMSMKIPTKSCHIFIKMIRENIDLSIPRFANRQTPVENFCRQSLQFDGINQPNHNFGRLIQNKNILTCPHLKVCNVNPRPWNHGYTPNDDYQINCLPPPCTPRPYQTRGILKPYGRQQYHSVRRRHGDESIDTTTDDCSNEESERQSNSSECNYDDCTNAEACINDEEEGEEADDDDDDEQSEGSEKSDERRPSRSRHYNRRPHYRSDSSKHESGNENCNSSGSFCLLM